MIDVKVTVFFFCLFFLFKCTLANESPSSNEISKKNGTVQGDCIACDALFVLGFCYDQSNSKANS